MKQTTTILLAVIVFLTIACQKDQSSSDHAAVANFDLTGYETTNLPEGVIRAIRKDRNGLVKEEGYIKDGNKTGVWTTYVEDRPESITSYVDGVKYGKSFSIDHILHITDEATYVNGQLHGKKGRYKRGRPLEEGHYISGKPHGPHRLYYESGRDQGKIRQYVEYVNGKIHGKFRTYNASGEVTTEYDYKNGEKVGGGIVK